MSTALAGVFNPLSANPTKWSNILKADELFECV